MGQQNDWILRDLWLRTNSGRVQTWFLACCVVRRSSRPDRLIFSTIAQDRIPHPGERQKVPPFGWVRDWPEIGPSIDPEKTFNTKGSSIPQGMFQMQDFIGNQHAKPWSHAFQLNKHWDRDFAPVKPLRKDPQTEPLRAAVPASIRYAADIDQSGPTRRHPWQQPHWKHPPDWWLTIWKGMTTSTPLRRPWKWLALMRVGDSMSVRKNWTAGWQCSASWLRSQQNWSAVKDCSKPSDSEPDSSRQSTSPVLHIAQHHRAFLVSFRSSASDLWNPETFSNGSHPEFHFVANDPLSKGIAVGARPVSVCLSKRIAAWRWFNPLNNW